MSLWFSKGHEKCPKQYLNANGAVIPGCPVIAACPQSFRLVRNLKKDSRQAGMTKWMKDYGLIPDKQGQEPE